MKTFTLYIIITVFAVSLHSQNNSPLTKISDEKTDKDSLRIYLMEPLVVTGTRSEVLRKYMPLTVNSINETDILNSGETNVLKLISSRVPGVFVTSRSNLGFGLAQGSAGQVYIRGTGSSPNTQILMLLDGRPQFMGLMGHPLPDNYITANAEKIEIVRGPCSFLYGSNAMGGVINIITKRQKEKGFRVRLNQSFGSFSTLIGDAGLGYNSGKFDMYISASNQQSNGSRAYSDFRLNNGYSKIGYKIDNNFNLTADANVTKFKTYDPGTIYKPLVDNWVDILRGNAGFSLDNSFKRTDGSVKFIINYGKHSIYDGFESTDRNVSVTAYQSFKIFNDNILSAGIDHKNYGGKARNIITGKDWGEHYVNETGAYVQLQQVLLEKFSVNAGIRMEHSSVFGNEMIPQIGLTVNYFKNYSFRLNVSKGFRSPTIRELYLFPAPNPDLQPEKMWNYETGIIAVPLRNLTVEAAAFYNRGNNIIITEGVFPNLKLSNAGDFEKKGFEVSFKYRPLPQLLLNANYSFTDPGQQTLSIPWHKLYSEAFLQMKFAGLKINAEHVSKIYGDNFSRKRLEDFTLLNAKVFVYPAQGFEFFVECENILNKEYQVIYGYPMPKAAFYIGINYNR